jgi:CD109 antigen
LWLTAFVMKTFAQARDLIYIDEGVLAAAADWIRMHEGRDGAYAPFGFVHHTEMMGGATGETALTAYIAVALHEAGHDAGASVRYLEDALRGIDEDYPLALTAYALALTDSPLAAEALDMLLAQAQVDDEGLHWGGEVVFDEWSPYGGPVSIAVETTAYAALALLARGELIDAASAIRCARKCASTPQAPTSCRSWKCRSARG